MSHSTDDETHSQSSGTDEVENYESNDADSLNFDEEEEEEDGATFPLSCNLSDNLLGGSIVLHIDQAHHHHMMNEPGAPGSRIGAFAIPILQGQSAVSPYENNESNLGSNNNPPGMPPTPLLQADQSASTTTSLSDAASDNMSTRAVMGDPPSTSVANGFGIGEEDADNSSQASLADSEADRVRRIHNSIFNSLENDLAELVRIREETIQFLESGSRSNNSSGENTSQSGENNETANSSEATTNGNNNAERQTTSSTGGDTTNRNVNDMGGDPFFLRERLAFHSRPFPNFTGGSLPRTSVNNVTSGDANTIVMNGRTYTPIAKFDNAPPGKPAKPYVEKGPTGCDEKAAAARKIMDKLQYGDPEDESACFVRRFWRETTTVDTAPPQVTSPMSLDIAAMAERTASLEATLEEAFDSIRLRLQQAAAESSPTSSTQNQEGQQASSETNNENNGSNTNNTLESNENHQRLESNSVPYYQAWDEETSIMNNPLNYDIWNELDDGNDAGPTITARINLAERRANAVSRVRNNDGDRNTETNASRGNQRSINSPSTRTSTAPGMTSMGVSTNEGAEMDDDSTDDEEISNYLAYRANDILNRNNNTIQNMSQESRNFFREIGIPEDLGRDLFNMFTFSEDEVRIPSTSNNNGENQDQDTPEPLFPRNGETSEAPTSGTTENQNAETPDNAASSTGENNSESRPVCTTVNGNDEDEDENSASPPQIPLVTTEPGIRFTINRNDDCSTRVYLDEHDMNFPYERTEETNQD